MRRPADEAAQARPRLNMTPMIDVTFQLIIVFLCSMKFRTLDMKIESRLPDEGSAERVQPPDVRPRARLRLARVEGGETRISLGGTPMGAIAEGGAAWDRVASRLRAIRAADSGVIGEIDATPTVRHGDVVHAMDLFVGAGIEDVRFRGSPPAR